MKTTVLFAALALFAGCADTQLGSEKALRFGLQRQYTETTGFAPVARGQTLELAVQAATKTGLLNEYDYLEATLTIADPDGNAVPVERTAKGKFTTRFPRTGTHVLTATLSDGKRDTLSVEVVEQGGLRLARSSRTITTRDAANGSCTTSLADDVAPTLAKNQQLNATLVALDTFGYPVLGLLDLEFSGPITVTPTTFKVRANDFDFVPTASGTLTLHVTDKVTQQTSDLTFTVGADDAVCPAK